MRRNWLFAGLGACVVLGAVWLVTAGRAASPSGDEPGAEARTFSAVSGEAQGPRKGSSAAAGLGGHWKFTEGSVEIDCTGASEPFHKTSSLQGNSFELRESKGSVEFVGTDCSYPMAGNAAHLEANGVVCSTSRGTVAEMRVERHTIRPDKDSQVKVEMTSKFETTIPKTGTKLSCTASAVGLAKLS